MFIVFYYFLVYFADVFVLGWPMIFHIIIIVLNSGLRQIAMVFKSTDTKAIIDYFITLVDICA